MLVCSPILIFSQVVYQDLTNTGIYDFLDELANIKIISLNSAIKPYSRLFIAEKLQEAGAQRDLLNKRQQKELAFYLKDYNLELKPNLAYLKKPKGLFRKNNHLGIPLSPLALLYKDSLFTFSLRPIWGIKYYFNENSSESGTVYHRWGGAEIFGYIGKHFGFYSSLRDNHETQILVNETYFTQDEGANWKGSPQGGGDYSEMRGGLTYSWKWGTVIFVKDHFQWGDNYNGSTIIAGRTPSFPYFQLQMKPVKWFEYNYFHGWLISEVVDSTRSWTLPDGGTREYYFNKYMAGAMFTFTPVDNLTLSLGNSVVYTAKYMNPAFLSPFLFFIDFNYTGNSFQEYYFGQNSQLFINISSRNIRRLHLYGSLFIDDFRWKVFTDKNMLNYISYKAGLRLSDLFRQNITFTAEYTLTNPGTYKSPVSTLTYASNQYNLGHFMRDNSNDIYFAIGYRPVRGLFFNVSYEFAQHGEDIQYTGNTKEPDYSMPLLEDLTYESQSFSAGVKYEFINNAYVYIEYTNRNITGDVAFTPPVFRGNTNTMMAGFNFGF